MTGLLRLRGLLLLFRRHVMPHRTTAGRAQNPVMCHMTGNTADDGTLDAALGHRWCRTGGNQGEAGDNRKN